MLAPLGYKLIAFLLMAVVLAGMSLVMVVGDLLQTGGKGLTPSLGVSLALLALVGLPHLLTFWLWRTLGRRPAEWRLLSLGQSGWRSLLCISYLIGCVCGVLFLAEII